MEFLCELRRGVHSVLRVVYGFGEEEGEGRVGDLGALGRHWRLERQGAALRCALLSSP